MLLPGATYTGAILGNYRVLDLIARGGMGSVYRARHAVLGRPAAIKLLRPELTSDPALLQRFVNEAKAATQIRHPGVVEVYDYGTTEDGLAYLVMELLEGVSLEQRLAERGRMAIREAIALARGIAGALRAAHREGIVHRDLKPANVFLVPDPDAPVGDRIKILDFGIAKLVEPARTHHTMTGALIGTPLYMAPEQARAAHTIDHRADLYSLGCILYEMIVGQPPFRAAGAGELIALHLLEAPTPPSQRAAVPVALDLVVMRLLAKEPAERYATAADVIAALDALGTASVVPPVAAAPGGSAARVGFRTVEGLGIPPSGPRAVPATPLSGAAAALAADPDPEARGAPLAPARRRGAPEPDAAASSASAAATRRGVVSFAAGALTMALAVVAGLIAFSRGSDPAPAAPAPSRSAPEPAPRSGAPQPAPSATAATGAGSGAAVPALDAGAPAPRPAPLPAGSASDAGMGPPRGDPAPAPRALRVAPPGPTVRKPDPRALRRAAPQPARPRPAPGGLVSPGGSPVHAPEALDAALAPRPPATADEAPDRPAPRGARLPAPHRGPQ
jgi:serine/threonine-protein kinase